MGVQQGIQGFRSAGTFQTVFHGCSLDLVTNQSPFQGQAAETCHRMERNSEMTKAIRAASGYMQKLLEGLGDGPGTRSEWCLCGRANRWSSGLAGNALGFLCLKIILKLKAACKDVCRN